MKRQEFIKIIEELQDNITTISKNPVYSRLVITRKYSSAYLCDQLETISTDMCQHFQRMFGFGCYGDVFSFLTEVSERSINEKIIGLELFKLKMLETNKYRGFRLNEET